MLVFITLAIDMLESLDMVGRLELAPQTQITPTIWISIFPASIHRIVIRGGMASPSAARAGKESTSMPFGLSSFGNLRIVSIPK